MAEEDGCDWRGYLDTDEFYLPPVNSIPEFLRLNAKYDAVRGILVDRLARDGFVKLQPGRDIFAQYPLNASLTNDLLGATSSKVFFHRGRLPVVCPGHHSIASDAYKAAPEWLPCYHFKWDREAIERIEQRMLSFRRQGVNWWIQAERFLQAVDTCWDYLFDPQHGEVSREYRVREWIASTGQEERRTRRILLRLQGIPG